MAFAALLLYTTGESDNGGLEELKRFKAAELVFEAIKQNQPPQMPPPPLLLHTARARALPPRDPAEPLLAAAAAFLTA